ncbi:LOW QUALITY PROTEIN: very-long-chain enoyl-CoA reductase [Nelusetta ayraudi]|uniref:LOW QUALITY PROTEIN: very-long-chain enoyl-CoA reductase n=1 Tax=Nelusetta ayraudi TaxID=303726 RepID=UPI003F719CF1
MLLTVLWEKSRTMSRTSTFEVKVLDANTREQLCLLDKVEPYSTIGDIKSLFHKTYPHWHPSRQALKLDPKEKALKDDEILQNLPVGTTVTLYFRDLGPQIGWTMVSSRPPLDICFKKCILLLRTMRAYECILVVSLVFCLQVFFAECVGSLLSYLLFYFRAPYVYSQRYALASSHHPVVTLACACHTFHYAKRLLETIFVHHFSPGTMPLRAIVRNCAYYWGFSAWLAYYINHPLYTPPTYGDVQAHCALVMFAMCELGNFSIHLTLSHLKRDGSRCRRFPVPTKNPFTWLFLLVSCPNYTYEVGAWVSFSIMTQCLPVALYTLLGFIQMTVWAKGKHRAYGREFKDYPSLRMAIIPLVL